MIKAKEVLKNKFWIVEDKGEKVATISFNDETYMLSDNTGASFYPDVKSINEKFGKQITWAGLEIKETIDHSVNGFPTNGVPYNALYDVKRRLPLFTKSEKSKSLYCAGYYTIRFEKGWVKSFCPKLITVERYETRGPFRTDLEMKQELSKVNARSSS